MEIIVKEFYNGCGNKIQLSSDVLSKAIEQYKIGTNNLENSFGFLLEDRKLPLEMSLSDITHKISSIEQDGDNALKCEIVTIKTPTNVLEEILNILPEGLKPVASGWVDEDNEFHIHSINFIPNTIEI